VWIGGVYMRNKLLIAIVSLCLVYNFTTKSVNYIEKVHEKSNVHLIAIDPDPKQNVIVV
jgi:hypothetical protein